jgi:Cation transport ATPase (P-type)
MSRAQVIVKRLGAIHDLGSMDVLCTDKLADDFLEDVPDLRPLFLDHATGTLTEAKIRLARWDRPLGVEDRWPFEWAWLNNHFQGDLCRPLDARGGRCRSPCGSGWAKLDEVPFDFDRRRVSVLVEHAGRRFLVTKGAPEDVLSLAGSYQATDNLPPPPAAPAARHHYGGRRRAGRAAAVHAARRLVRIYPALIDFPAGDWRVGGVLSAACPDREEPVLSSAATRRRGFRAANAAAFSADRAV